MEKSFFASMEMNLNHCGKNYIQVKQEAKGFAIKIISSFSPSLLCLERLGMMNGDSCVCVCAKGDRKGDCSFTSGSEYK